MPIFILAPCDLYYVKQREAAVSSPAPSALPGANSSVPTHVVTLTQVRTSVYLGQTHLRTLVQVPAWVRKFSLGSTGDEISSLIIICTAEVCILNSHLKWLQVSRFQTFSR